MVRLINSSCIAVGLTDHRSDARGAAHLAGFSGGGNGLWIVTPSGKSLSKAYEIHEGLKKWRELTAAERKQDAAAAKKMAEAEAEPKKATKPILTPPEGGVIVKFHQRFLDRNRQGEYSRVVDNSHVRLHSEPQHDHLWLTQPEWRSLLPKEPRVGQQVPVPEALAKRILCGYLVVEATGAGPMWKWEDLKTKELTLTVRENSANILQLVLEGRMKVVDRRPVHVSHKDGKRIYETHDFGIDAHLLGYVSYDKKKDALTRFDAVAVANIWGHEGFDHPSFRTGQYGWAFHLVSGESWLDRIPPSTLWRRQLHDFRLE